MRLMMLVLACLMAPSFASAGSDGSLQEPSSSIAVQEGPTQVVRARVADLNRNPGRRDGSSSRSVGAQVACRSEGEIGADLQNLPDDFDDIVVIDPETGDAHVEQVLRRRWIRIYVNCGSGDGAVTFVSRRCVWGDCPVGEDAGQDVLPNVELLVAQAVDTADYEVPEPLFSPERKPGKAPIPGMPFFFAQPIKSATIRK